MNPDQAPNRPVLAPPPVSMVLPMTAVGLGMTQGPDGQPGIVLVTSNDVARAEITLDAGAVGRLHEQLGQALEQLGGVPARLVMPSSDDVRTVNGHGRRH